MLLVPARELADHLATVELTLDAVPLIAVRLDDDISTDTARATAEALRRAQVVAVGVGPVAPAAAPLAHALDLTLVTSAPADRTQVQVDDLDAALAAVADGVTVAPLAALTLRGVLAITAGATVRNGLAAESAAYSTLLGSAEFRRWRAARARREATAPAGPAVLLSRDDDRLEVLLNRPERHNAFDRSVRDGLVEALDLALLDTTITSVSLSGAGASFCSGGDLDEFGTATDPATAHLIRLERSVAARIHQCRDRVRVRLHGACIGAGIELPSFAGWVEAAEDTRIRLPELAMGLIPGAGGTVGIPRRIGRWRTAYLALTGAAVGAATAAEWGLVDARI